MFVFDYGTGLLAVLTVFITLLAIFIVMCRRAVRQEQVFYQTSVHERGLKEVLPLLLYTLIYLVPLTAIVATLIYDAAVSMTSWWVYSIAVYLARLFIPLFSLLHVSRLCCRKKQTRQHVLTTTTLYVVPNEFTDQEDELLIIRGQRTKVPSKEYKSIFEGTTEY